tara:strand:- start:442 stop:927 length:486 start_codon:yes stop_codon:yes gene_type:complete
MINLEKFKKSNIYGEKSFITNLVWYFINNIFFNSFIPGSKIRIFLLRLFGSNIGKNVYLKPKINIKFPWKLRIGENSWIGEKVWIDNISEIDIGKNCCISQGVYLCTGNHDFKKESFDLISEKIIIEDSVWVGAKSIIGPGSKISYGKFIKLGSIHSKKDN